MSSCQVRVGRVIGTKTPKFEGFRNVLCLTPSTPYGKIGPYCLKDSSSRIMENIYQGCKVYIRTPDVREVYSRWDQRVIWERKAETHVISEFDLPNDFDTLGYIEIATPVKGIEGKAFLTPSYMQWRFDLKSCQDPIRYPVGRKARGWCVGALSEEELHEYNSGNRPDGVHLLDYIEARKQIYVKLYQRLVLEDTSGLFQKLLAMSRVSSVLIIEVDGPHQESLEYYKKHFGVKDDFIIMDTILATEENLTIMLNDPKHPYGHGYALADLIAKLK